MQADDTIESARLAWQRGDLARTDAICRAILTRTPAQGEAIFLRGLVAFRHGDAASARALLQQAASLAPLVAAVHSSLGTVLASTGEVEAALACFRRAIQLDARFVEGWINLGLTALNAGRHEEARRALERVVALQPNIVDAHVFLGLACDHLGDSAAALRAFEHALTLAPANNDAHLNIVAIHQAAGRMAPALAACERAVAQGCATAWMFEQMGLLRVDLGEPAAAGAAYAHALAAAPDNAGIHSNKLLALLYDPQTTPRAIRMAAEEWNARHTRALAPVPLPALAPRAGRPLRVGYLSRDFRQHPIAFFLAGVLAHHDRAAVHAICYSDTTREDAWTARLKAQAGAWVDIAGLDDPDAARRIAADGLDILIELGGHTGQNRLRVCAMRPAPVQATWLGYPATTGLSAIDYFISDRFETPPGAEAEFSERVIRLQDGYLCYTPPDDAPPVAALPALAAGHVTFGCLNNPAKLNAAAFELWARILEAVPRSRLVLLAAIAGERDTQARVEAFFAARGIAPERIEVLARRPHQELLAAYARIDLALDPVPYTGGLTTCEALWMGVPVVTLAGATFPARHSLTHLTQAGLAEFATDSADAYVRRAIDAVADLPALADLRASLRARVAASPLADAARFTRGFEGALREMVEAKR